MLCSSSWYFMQFKTSLYYTSFSLYHDYSSVCLSRSTTLFWVAQIKAVILDHLYYLIPIIRNRSWYYGTAHEAATWDASILCKRLGYKAKLLCFQSRSLLMCLEKNSENWTKYLGPFHPQWKLRVPCSGFQPHSVPATVGIQGVSKSQSQSLSFLKINK